MRIYKPSFWSLAFPVGIIIYSGYKLIDFSRYGMGIGSYFMFTWSFLAAIVIGGVLPIILTFALKIETREYFLPRLIFYVCTIAAVSIPREFVTIPKGGLVILTAFSAAVTLLYFYKFRPTRFSEWFVIFLSTPQIYMMIYYLLVTTDIDNLQNAFAEMYS